MKSKWSAEVVSTIDMLLSFAVAMLVTALLVIPATPANTLTDRSICSMAIDIEWPIGRDLDIDLWAQAPGDKPVGYSSKDGTYLNLVRDDLGNVTDTTKINTERVCARGVAVGEYTVNIHYYMSRDKLDLPVPVAVVVSAVDPSSAIMTQLISKTVFLRYRGEELTVFRFSLDISGKLVSGSVHDIPKPLRSMKNND